MAGGEDNENDTIESLFDKLDKQELTPKASRASDTVEYSGGRGDVLLILNRFRIEGNSLCDIVLEVQGKLFPAHRNVLAANSRFFHAMFTSGMKESSQNLWKLHTVSACSFELVLNYFYTGRIVVTKATVEELLETASFLLLEPLKKACFHFLSEILAPENCFSLKILADKYSELCFSDQVRDLAEEHFQQCVENEHFLALTKDEVIDLISSDEIQVEKEEHVYFAILKWVKHNIKARKDCLPTLCRYLRVGSLSKNFLQDQLFSEQLIRDNNKCRRIFQQFLKQKEKHKVNSPSADTFRPSTDCVEVIIGAGTQYCVKAFCYDMKLKETFCLQDLPKTQINPDLVSIGRTVYIVGGMNGDLPNFAKVPCLRSFSFKTIKESGKKVGTKEWQEKAPFKTCRSSYAVTVFGNKIYVIGGRGEHWTFRTVEQYDPNTDFWVYVSPLNFARSDLSAVATRHYIYAIGGSSTGDANNARMLQSVERYDARKNKWTIVSPLNYERRYPETIYAHDKVFVIGGLGRNVDDILESSEVYHPAIDEWHLITPPPHLTSSYCNLLNLRGDIIMLYGGHGACKAVKYDDENDIWVDVKAVGPSDKIIFYSLCTVSLPRCYLNGLSPIPNDFFDE